jgi:IclR family transcriptional regulator, acetate operon repressor
MPDVRSVARALRIFEVFAASGVPMTLSEIAAKIKMPPSSCLLIIRTLLARGYLYTPGRRNAYYPTQRLADVAKDIARNDPIIARFQPHLEHLRDETREMVTLAKLQGKKLIYLAVAESREVVRATTKPGVLRPLHSTATGKALLAALDAAEREALINALELEPMTDRTIDSADDLRRAVAEVARRGYAINAGESVAGLSAVSVASHAGDGLYAITIMGPSQRFDPRTSEYGRMLVDYVRVVERDLSGRVEDAAFGDA